MMLDQGRSNPEENLTTAAAPVAWSYLRPHFERGALIFVDPSLPLESVSSAIAADDHLRVKTWLKAGDLVKIESLHAAQWESSEGDCFEALVVSPFVLFRPLA